MLTGLHHVQLAMPPGGEVAARAFYSGLLGLTEVGKPANLAKRGGCWFEQGDVRVHLGTMVAFRPATKAHPAFLVNDLSALRAACGRAGCDHEDDEPLQGFLRKYVRDPFGNRIEFMQPDPQSDGSVASE